MVCGGGVKNVNGKICEALAKPPLGCLQERSQNTGVRIKEHVASERVPILNSEFWLLNTALAEPTKEVLQAPHVAPLLQPDCGNTVGPAIRRCREGNVCTTAQAAGGVILGPGCLLHVHVQSLYQPSGPHQTVNSRLITHETHTSAQSSPRSRVNHPYIY
jgi:hypothetical protein